MDYPHLFEPLTVRRTVISNRLEAAPVSIGPVQKGETPYAQVQAELMAHSSGGVGLYTIGEAFISQDGNRRQPPEFFDYTDLSEDNLLPYRTAAGIVKGNGCVTLIELSHCGRRRGGQAFGPMEETTPEGAVVTAMDEAMIEKACEDFANAAHYMEKAGFNGVMLHCGHGWLIHQFLSPLTNRRTDRFGGSIENRTRLARMVIDRVRQKTGPDFLIALRMSGDELCPGGYDYHEFVRMAALIEEQADIIQVSMGLYGNPVLTREFPSAYHGDGCNAYIAEALKKTLRHAKVSVVGAVNDPAVAERILAGGQADLVAMGRQMFADPTLPDKAKCGQDALIHPCLRCFCCFSGPLDAAAPEDNDWMPGCSVNPRHMRYEYNDMPAPEKRFRILVAGGGIAGLYFAARAQERGHQVTVIEKSPVFGGILNCVKNDPHKHAYIRYIRSLKAEALASGAALLPSTTANESLIANLRPEVIVSAVGASAASVALPMEEGASTMQAVGAIDRLAEIGPRVLILGGGLVGCELAVFLAENGRAVTVAARHELIKNVYPLQGMALDIEMNKLGVQRLPQHAPIMIRKDGALLRNPDGAEKFCPADTVITALGLAANRHDADALKRLAEASGAAYYEIGDCKKPRRIREATSEAFLLAMQLGTDYRPKPLKSLWIKDS